MRAADLYEISHVATSGLMQAMEGPLDDRKLLLEHGVSSLQKLGNDSAVGAVVSV